MGVEMKIPPVGESISEVIVASWLKKEGDYVQMDEVICELESEKASFELPAAQAGILHIKANEGDTVEIGAVICEIEPKGAKTKTPEIQPAKTAPEIVPEATSTKATGEVKEMIVPTVGES
ncbi:MAG: dihydrolipoamide succinyltransferase, partial [Cyclobacteriaceae bacterium]|nr:dihydrolipoamide succinyltransferase [Cyclobacteriaceae bacterium]